MCAYRLSVCVCVCARALVLALNYSSVYIGGKIVLPMEIQPILPRRRS